MCEARVAKYFPFFTFFFICGQVSLAELEAMEGEGRGQKSHNKKPQRRRRRPAQEEPDDDDDDEDDEEDEEEEEDLAFDRYRKRLMNRRRDKEELSLVETAFKVTFAPRCQA